MGFSWDLTGIENYEEVCWGPGPDGEINPITKGLIWRAMTVGLPTITVTNYQKWFQRSVIVSAALGSKAFDEFDEETQKFTNRDYTLAEIKAHIGLVTSHDKFTDAAFSKNVRRALEVLSEKALTREIKKAKEKEAVEA